MKDKTDSEGRKYVGIYFKCCHVYSRVYKSKAGDRYAGFGASYCGRESVDDTYRDARHTGVNGDTELRGRRARARLVHGVNRLETGRVVHRTVCVTEIGIEPDITGLAKGHSSREKNAER